MGSQTWENILEMDDVRECPDVPAETSVALQSQYSASQRIRKLGNTFRAALDATDVSKRYRDEICNLQFANGMFLDWWGERIGVNRNMKIKGGYHNFDDEYYRFLLNYKAVSNIANATADTANKMLQRLTDTTVFVVDYLDMTINSIVIIGAISDLQATVLQNFGLLNRPAGVLTNMLVIYPDELIFGFDGQDLLPFEVGVFNPSRTIDIT